MTLQEVIRKHEWLHLLASGKDATWDDVDRIADVCFEVQHFEY